MGQLVPGIMKKLISTFTYFVHFGKTNDRCPQVFRSVIPKNALSITQLLIASKLLSMIDFSFQQF